MFYTKYRPQKFSEISKPNAIAEALMNQVKGGKVGHAYLFVGPRGTGKTTTARILAKALNCSKITKDGDPCDKCDACAAVKVGNFLDLIEIDAASNRGIDDVRDLRDKIKLAPAHGKQKIYIIDEVHMLTVEAFNALLKTLEEPPSHATFMLCTTESHKVPDTIKSRCQVFNFKRASLPQLIERLGDIAKKEKGKVSKKDLEKIARASHGGFRDAETLLQQVIEGELDVEAFVGTSSLQDYSDFVDSLQFKDTASAIRQINKVYEDGVDLYVWSDALLRYLRDLLFIAADASEGLIDVSEDIFAIMESQAAKIDPSEIAFISSIFIDAQKDIRKSSIPQLPLEVAVVKVCEGWGSFVNGNQELLDNNDNNSGNSKESKPSKKSVKKAKNNSSSKLNTPFDTVESAWEDVLKGVVSHNHGVQALLKASKPIALDEDCLVLEVFYKFHKERLETSKNRQIIEKVLNEIFDEPIKLRCTLAEGKPIPKTKHSSGDLTDMNIGVASEVKSSDSIMDVFDGGLPL